MSAAPTTTCRPCLKYLGMCIVPPGKNEISPISTRVSYDKNGLEKGGKRAMEEAEPDLNAA